LTTLSLNKSYNSTLIVKYLCWIVKTCSRIKYITTQEIEYITTHIITLNWSQRQDKWWLLTQGPLLQKYYHIVKNLVEGFDKFNIINMYQKTKIILSMFLKVDQHKKDKDKKTSNFHPKNSWTNYNTS